MSSLFKRLPSDIVKSYMIHMILIPKNNFNSIEAKQYLKNHNNDFIAFHNSKNFYKFKINHPIPGLNLYPSKKNNGIIIVYNF